MKFKQFIIETSTLDWNSVRSKYTLENNNYARIDIFNNAGAVGYIEWDVDDGEIQKVFVGKPYRRQGVGTYLWELVEKWTSENNMTEPEHSSKRTFEGDAWAKSIGGHIPDITDDIDGWTTRQIQSMKGNHQMKLKEFLLAEEKLSKLEKLQQSKPEKFQPISKLGTSWSKVLKWVEKTLGTKDLVCSYDIDAIEDFESISSLGSKGDYHYDDKEGKNWFFISKDKNAVRYIRKTGSDQFDMYFLKAK